MIKTRNQLPEYYYKESRDFQFIGRLFDVLLNYNKTSIDSMRNNPLSKNIDDSLIDLCALTVGFSSKRDYDTDDLKAICTSFNELLRKKGTKSAIETCVEVLLKSKNISDKFSVNINTETYEVELLVPAKLSDLRILEDLFTYLLPTGFVPVVIHRSSYSPNALTEFVYGQKIRISNKKKSDAIGVFNNESLPTTNVEISMFNEGIGVTDDTTVVMPTTIDTGTSEEGE